MPTISTKVYRWLYQKPALLEDFADRLNHVWTVGLLLFLACAITVKQSYNKPIVCSCPIQLGDAMAQYTESVCWNSYAIHYPENRDAAAHRLNITRAAQFRFRYSEFALPVVSPDVLDNSLLTKAATTTTLYQWISLILCFQALLFKLPSIVMYVLQGYTGISFDKIHGLTIGYERMSLDERKALGQQIGRYILRWCRRFGGFPPWRLLTVLWLFVKILFCVNVVVQVRVLNSFVVPGQPLENSTFYGDSISEDLTEDNATLWKESPVLPRFVMCIFDTYLYGTTPDTYKIKCHLPGNVFNEQALMLLWVWLVFVAVVTFTSLIVWLIKILVPVLRKR